MNELGRALGTNVPDHVANRLHALTGGAPVQLVTGTVDTDDQGRRSGEVVVFTEKLVAVATLDGSDFFDTYSDDESIRSVEASVWSRRRLKEMFLIGEDNMDIAWNWAGDEWAREFRLRLTYSNLASATVVQSTKLSPVQQQAVSALIPSLFDDLEA